MLDKIAFFRDHTAAELAAERATIDPVRALAALGMAGAPWRKLGAGTLSASFIVEPEGGSPLCLKTSVFQERRDAFRSEIEASRAVLGEELAIGDVDDGERLWMTMPVLRVSPSDTRPDAVDLLIQAYQARLQSAPEDHYQGRNFAALLARGEEAICELIRPGLLARNVGRAVANRLCYLSQQAHQLAQTPCHGDLGPENIMSGPRKPVAIDWEDVFLGVPDYDRLYWLTFMRNRPLLRRENLPRRHGDIALDVAILALVVTLKCYLSVLRKSHGQDQLSFDARVLEVLSLD